MAGREIARAQLDDRLVRAALSANPVTMYAAASEPPMEHLGTIITAAVAIGLLILAFFPHRSVATGAAGGK